MVETKRALSVATAVALIALFAAGPAGGVQRDARANPAPEATTPSPAPAPGAKPQSAAAKPAKPHDENGIVSLVNDVPITQYELRQRMNLVMATSNIPKTAEMEKKVRDQVLEQLQTELLQRAEAAKNDITISSVEVDKYMQNIIDENHMSKEQLEEILKRGGVQMATFRAQLAAQLLWQKAVQEHYAGRINISPESVDAEMARISEGANKAHFSVSEIFLPVDNPDLDEKVRKDAENLASQLKAGGHFPDIARQFSQSPSAAQGGDIGTVYDGQLAPELNKTLLAMKTGELSEPVRSIGGYYILLLRQRMEPVGTKIEQYVPSAVALPESLPLGRVLLRIPPKADKDYIAKVMVIAEQLRSQVQGCDVAAKLPTLVPGLLYFPLGTVKLAELNQETRAAVAKAEPGGVAPAFRSDAGVELFVRCDKALEKKQAFVLPSRKQIENQLFSEQISALARRYNRDLKRSANIEVR